MPDDDAMKLAIKSLLKYIGEDPEREGLQDTPMRVLRSYRELFCGYDYSDDDIARLFTTFEDGACDEMVLLKDIDFVSFCEHHMLPFSGVVHVAYLPLKKVIGLSKMARVVEVYARRLQIQERFTQQITSTMMRHLAPRGAACVVEGRHSCMSCRGVKKPRAVMVTSSLTGDFRDASTRAEFFSLIK